MLLRPDKCRRFSAWIINTNYIIKKVKKMKKIVMFFICGNGCFISKSIGVCRWNGWLLAQ